MSQAFAAQAEGFFGCYSFLALLYFTLKTVTVTYCELLSARSVVELRRLSTNLPAQLTALDVIAKISPIPLLIIHSEQDRIIPVHHANHLFNAAQSPKELWISSPGGHIEALTYEGNRIKLLQYLEKILGSN